MKTAGAWFFAALIFFFGAHAAAAQGQRITSSWTTETVSGQGQPRGYVEYRKYCSACHSEGLDHPGTLALTAKYKGAQPATLDKRTDLTAALVKAFVRNGDTVMPIFRKTEISDADLDAIAAYLTRNSKP
jgi:mono/diheme cytochrome c family protein